MSPCARNRNRRGEGDRLKADIVRAAAQSVEETKGREAVTLRGVARKAGITAPSIYAHFSTVGEILEAVVAGTCQALVGFVSAEIARQQDPRARLAAACAAYTRFGQEHPYQYRLLFARDEQGVGSQAIVPDRPLEAEHGATAFRLLRETVAEHIRSLGEEFVEEELDESAIALWAGLHGYVGLRLALPAFPLPGENRMIAVLIGSLVRTA